MRFEQEKTPTPYLNRSDQYRMLGMLTLLLFVLVGVKYTANPRNWNWFFRLGDVPEANESLDELRLDDVNFLVELDESVPADTLVLADDEPAPPMDPQVGQDPRHIPPELLQNVEDRRLGILRTELPALHATVARLREFSADQLREGAIDVGYRAINVDPDHYRGQLVHLSGLLRSYTRFPLEDESGSADLYQGWLFTPDSGNNPWCVLCLERSPELEIASRIERQVEVDGYFLKRYGYPTETGAHVAPLLVAQSFRIQPLPQARARRRDDVSYYLLGLLAGIALLFGLMIWRFSISDRRFAQSRMAQIADSRLEAPSEAIETLKTLESTEPHEVFPAHDGAPPSSTTQQNPDR